MNAPIIYFASTRLSGDFNDYLLEYMRERFLPAGAFLLKAGEICHNLYFVESGLLRRFYYQDDKEISSGFVQPGEICWSVESFISRQKGIEYIQVLQRSYVVALSFEHIQCICRDFPLFILMKQQIMEASLIEQERRLQAMWMQRSDRKLAWFSNKFPALLKKLMSKHIASYLGITEVMLSRLLH